MSLLTTAQLTFCDLKDSYSIYMDTDCVGLACDNDGAVLETQTVTINYRALMGSDYVDASCEVSNFPSGVTLSSKTNASSSQSGTIVLNISKGATLGNQSSSNVKIVFKTLDSEQFTFDKYLTFVKYMVGESGADAITFKVYSNQGFVFKEYMNEIELKVAAFKGGDAITDATFVWEWWNSELNDGAGGYDAIVDNVPDEENTSGQSLTVYRDDIHALANLRCTMTYEGKTYEDYVSLSNEAVIYSSAIKFFHGSNVFDQSSNYIIAYVEVYKNNQLEESIKTNFYYDGICIIDDSGNIDTSVEGEFTNGDLMYFLYKKSEGKQKYDITLGKYADGSWIVCEDYESNYLYTSDIYGDMSCNIVVISKEDVAQSKEFNIQVYNKKSEMLISRTNATIIDINDPIISDTQPTNVKYGQLWLDTSSEPYTLWIYTKNDTPYTLAEGEQVLLSYALASSGGSSSTATTISYSDSISVAEDGAATLVDPQTVSVSYSANENAKVLPGKYFIISGIIYYAPEDSEIKIKNTASSGVSSWSVYVSLAQEVITDPEEMGKWVYFSQQNGGTVYTSKPEKYNAGDLWILAEGETCGDYSEGTMLRATVSSNVFDESHWEDAMDISATITNIKESFTWNEQGIQVAKRVTDSSGNVTTPFYVHIDSTRMGFHSVEYNSDGTVQKDVEVVHIGNNSATIQNATFEGSEGTVFENEATFNQQINIRKSGSTSGFIWKVEENGSLSLTIA